MSATPAEMEADLLPFRAAADAGVGSMMTAHVAYDAWEPNVPATLSRTVVHTLLRQRLQFDGLVVTDALVMDGVLAGGGGEAGAALGALRAGCDALLYPSDVAALAATLDEAVDTEAAWQRVHRASTRVFVDVARMQRAFEEPLPRPQDAEWAAGLAVRCCVPLRGSPVLPRDTVAVLVVDDDRGGLHAPPSRDAFVAALRRRGVDVRTFDASDADVTFPGSPLLAVYSDIRAWKGRPGLSTSARERMHALMTDHPDATVVLFGHPRLLAEDVPGAHVLGAWGGEAVMQRAAADWLLGGA